DGAKSAFSVNLAIYSDLYWAHQVYIDKKIPGLEELAKFGLIDPQVLAGFKLIDQGAKLGPKTDKGRPLVEAGNLMLFKREQIDIVTPLFERYSAAMQAATTMGLIRV